MKKTIITTCILLLSATLFAQTPDVLKKEIKSLKTSLSKSNKDRDSLQILVSKLIQDTTFLRKEIALCSLYNNEKNTEIENTNSNYKFTFISCKGNRQKQSVEITFMVQHKLVNQKFYNPQIGNAYDSQGQSYKINESLIGGVSTNMGVIPTEMPIKITFVITNILPGNELITLLQFPYESYNMDVNNGQKGDLNVKNIKIIWN